MGWLNQVLRETHSLSKLSSPEIPCVTFCPDEDELVSVSAVKDRMTRWPGGNLELVRNARHNLLLEKLDIRERILKKICDVFSGPEFRCD